MVNPRAPRSRRGLPLRNDRQSAATYRRLMQVSLRNTYYVEPPARADFQPAPTPETAALMRDLGMLFREEGDGFSILYDTRHEDDLLQYLRRHRTETKEWWTRLSFVLRLRNPFFGNFTRVPIDLDPTARNFYFTNEEAHERGNTILLNRDRYVTGRELVTAVPVQVPVVVGREVREVRVRGISGEVVLCAPRCVPAGLAAASSPDRITGENVAAYFAERQDGCRVQWVCRNTIYLDFSTLPEGLYFIQEIGRGGCVLRERRVLHTAPGQYAFIDLLFSEPRPKHGGVYPVRPPGAPGPRIVPRHYELSFLRRSTYWRYYIVLPREVDALSIATEPPGAVTFCGPYRVVVGSATQASLFISETPVALSQRPPARFILKSGNGTLMESMPVASVQQVLPVADSPPDGNSPRFIPNYRDYSDIYVNV